MWKRLYEILNVWYEALADEARTSTYLHADETGWQVNGITNWSSLNCLLLTRIAAGFKRGFEIFNILSLHFMTMLAWSQIITRRSAKSVLQ